MGRFPLENPLENSPLRKGPLRGSWYARAAKRGGFKRGLPDLDLSFLFCPFLSFLGFSRFSGIFPICPGTPRGIFPICPFPLSRPINSTYEEQSQKGLWHNLRRETPPFGNSPVQLLPSYAMPHCDFRVWWKIASDCDSSCDVGAEDPFFLHKCWRFGSGDAK